MPSERLSGPDLSQYDAQANFVVRTGQTKKLRYARILSLVGGVILFAGWVTAQRSWGIALILVGTCVGLIGFVWQCLAVRCPACRVAVVWYTFKTRTPADADDAALYQRACPKCGYDPVTGVAVNREAG